MGVIFTDYINNEERIRVEPCASDSCLPHCHPFLELVYVIRGQALHQLNHQTVTLRPGDYFIVDYDTYHQYKKTGKEPFEIINCLFQPDFIDKTLTKCRKFSEILNSYLVRYSYETLNANPANFIFHDEEGVIAALVRRLLEEYKEKLPGYLEMMRCELVEIILHTVRKLSNKNAVVCTSWGSYMKEYIDNHYMEHITLSSLSKALQCSLPYLSKKFKEEMGMTFQEYLQRVRIEQSCHLLANSDKKVIEIAHLVGYEDLKFFNTLFKKQLSVTPREFKKLHR